MAAIRETGIIVKIVSIEEIAMTMTMIAAARVTAGTGIIE